MRWSLATQLRLGFCAAFLLVLGVSAGAWWVAASYRDAINVAYRTHLLTTMQLAEAESALWELRYGFPQFMIGSPEERQRILGAQDKWYAIVEERLAAYRDTARDAEERRMLTGLRSAYQRYKQTRPKFFELWEAGEKDEAIAWGALTTTPFGAETVRAFATQIALQRSLAERARAAATETVRLALALVTAITVALLVMLVISYAYSVRLLRPIVALRLQAQRVVREQLGETIDASTSANEVAALVQNIQLMSDRLLAHAESLRQSRERLDFLLRATPAVIYSAKAHGDYAVNFMSANVRAILGYEPEDFLRDPGFRPSNIHPDDRERVFAGLATRATQDTHADEYRYHHKDGSWRWMHDETALIRDTSGAPQERVGYWIDISRRRAAEIALQAALEAAEGANRAKSAFLSRMSHELRTPLNAVLGFAQLLGTEPLTPGQEEAAAEILKAGRHLLDLINEVLDISRIESGQQRVSPEPVPVGELVRSVLDLVRPLGAERSVQIEVDADRANGRYVLADRQWLQQVLLNLVANAIKFNWEGGRVRVACELGGGERMRITVTDTGPGIAEHLLPRLFTPFDRLGAEQTGVEGTGLGLALSRRLVEAMDGAIGVETAPGQGSTFWVELPLAAGPAPVVRPHPASAEAPAGRGETTGAVLYIEDNLSSVHLVELILDLRPGVRLLSAMQGGLGVELAQQHRPGLILLDLHLLDLQGDEVLGRLKADPRTREIPVVVLSADASPGEIQRLLAAGAHAYVTKPIDVREVLRLIDETVGGH